MQDLLSCPSTSFIPYIGLFMACGIECFSPLQKAHLSTHFTCRLYDRSNSGRKCRLSEGCRQFRGLPTILTLAAALIGGNLFGLVGMIFSHTNFAVIYRFVKEWVEKHEQAVSGSCRRYIDEEN